jgi:hypothetical protein
MADVQKILNLVSQGALSPEEADEILTALNATNAAPQDLPPTAKSSEQSHAGQSSRPGQQQPRHLRIQITERGRSVVNLRVPVNIATWAANYIPGLSDYDTDRIRGAIASGMSGPIIDIGDEDDRVIITSE